MTRLVSALALVLAVVVTTAPEAAAHATFLGSDPPPGSAFDEAPTVVRVTLSEEPALGLTAIDIFDDEGVAVEVGPVGVAADDPRTVEARIPELGSGVFTVVWETVSVVDGHRTAGRFVFGVGISPAQAAAALEAEVVADVQAPSVAELTGRWLLLGGLLTILGATVVSLGPMGRNRRLLVMAAVGTVGATTGLVTLVLVQAEAAGIGLVDHLGSETAAPTIVRGGALALAAGSLGAAAAARRSARPALVLTTIATVVAVVAHAEGGHAASGSGLGRLAALASQSVHTVAAGVWIGGLTALLVGWRRVDPATRSAAVRTFSRVAGWTLAVVVVSGVARAIDELERPAQLLDTGYGRTIAAKSALVLLLAAAGLVHRIRTVPGGGEPVGHERLFERLGRTEVVLGAGAISLAALLGATSPPVTAPPLGFDLSGHDAATTTRAHLETRWAIAGPNRFTLSLQDFDDGAPLDADEVTLRFDAVDDPRVPATVLELAEADAGVYVGDGNHLVFDGRWRVTATGTADSRRVVVPFEVVTQPPPLWHSVHDPKVGPVTHTVELSDHGLVNIVVEPEDASGRQRLTLRFFTWFLEPRRISEARAWVSADDGSTGDVDLRRIDATSFSAVLGDSVEPHELGFVARAEQDRRLVGRVPLED